MITQSLRRKTPPSLAKAAPKVETPARADLQQAQHREKDGVSLGKIAFGLGVAATALTGCTDFAAPAEPAYQLESPEVVVLSESTQRIDLSREQNCVGFGDFKECEDVAYHPVGIHLGEGIVQDMNGNLFAAPQIVSGGAPGAAVANPEILEADSNGYTGILQRSAPNTYQMGGDLFGRAEIQTGDRSRVMTPGLFKAKEHIAIDAGQQQAFIREHTGQVMVVKTHGDHISVHDSNGQTVAEVRHNERKNEYTVDHGFNQTSVSYNRKGAVRKEDGAAVSEVSRRADGSEWDNIEVKAGPHTVLRTSAYENGWSDTHSGPYGSRTDYVHTGGENLFAR